MTGAADAGPLPCVCGYDLRGLPPDGRCPECGRLVAHLRQAADVRRAVAAWRRQVAAGGVVVLSAYGLWAVALLATVRTAVGPVLPRLFAGPRPAVVLLLAVRRINPGASRLIPVCCGVATVALAAGLVQMSRIPPGLRTPRRVAAAGAVRVTAGVLVGLTLLVVPLTNPFHAGPSMWVRPALAWGGYAAAGVWAAVGWLLAEAAAAAGRWGLAARLGVGFAAAAALAFVGGLLYASTWFWWTPYGRAFLPLVDSATSAAALVLTGRFAATGLWSAGRWWAWAGHRCDPDADGV